MKQEGEEWRGACSACLTPGMRLYSLRRFQDVYLGLLNYLHLDDPTDSMWMCWECGTAIRRISAFLDKVIAARQTPATAVKSLYSVILKTTYDFEFNHDEEKIDIDVKIKQEIEADIPAADLYQHSPEQLYEEFDYETKNIELYDEQKTINVINAHALLETKTEPSVSNITNIKICKGVRLKKRITKTPKPKTIKYRRVKIQDCATLDEGKAFIKVKITMSELSEIRKEIAAFKSYRKATYKCNDCVVIFKSKELFLNHRRKRHNEKCRLACELCSGRVSSTRMMERHWRAHLTVYRCLECSYTRHRAGELRVHYRNNHGIRWQCTECGWMCAGKKSFCEHLREYHKQFVCDYCGHEYKTKDAIIKHMRRYHDQYHCKQCNKTYKDLRSLVQHERKSHEVSSATETAYCVECDKQFANVLKYRVHLNTSQKHRAEKRTYPCPDCGKVFHRATNLNSHRDLVHLNKAKNRCPHCGKCYTKPAGLRVHINSVHEGYRLPKTIPCEVCGRLFQTKRVLRNHMRTHTGERPYECHLCPARFTQKYAMESHLKNVHLHLNKKQRPLPVEPTLPFY